MVTITLKPDVTTFEASKDEPVLDAALRAGVQLPYGCRGGTCGACKAQLIEGEITYSGRQADGLTQDERSENWVLCCMAKAQTDLTLQAREIDTNREIPIKTLPARVMKMEQLTHDVMGLWLKIPAAERLQFLAGQYIDILMRDGKERSFSLANAPHDDEYLQLQIRYYEGGAFSEHVFNEMKAKSILRIRGPFGSFYLRDDREDPVIFVAGGTGFAPVKGIIEHMIASDDPRSVKLYWGARAKRDLYQDDLALGWAEEHELIEYIPVLSEPDANDEWQGKTGFVHDVVASDYDDFSGMDVYASGPPVMVHAVRDALLEKGLAEDRMFSDAFEFAATKK